MSTRTPVEDLRDPFLAAATSGSHSFVIYMAVEEEAESNFACGLAECADNCSSTIQQACFQRDGTRHLTMFEGTLSTDVANTIRFPEEFRFESFPIEFLKGFNDWNSGLYLETTQETTNNLKDLLNQLEGLPKGGRRPW